MTDRPIIMPAPMVRALLDGRKTQTRRLKNRYVPLKWGQGYNPVPTIWQSVKPGDRLWVRETHAFETCREVGWYPPPFEDGRPLRKFDDPDWGQYWDQAHYRATDKEPELAYDDVDDPRCRWRPSIHMPREFSRLTLLVTATKMERVKEISPSDAELEGAYQLSKIGDDPAHSPWTMTGEGWRWDTPDRAFQKYWRELHDTRTFDSWEDNPEVVALTFTVHQQNIDQMSEAT